MKPKTPGEVIRVLKDHIGYWKTNLPAGADATHDISCLTRAIAIVRAAERKRKGPRG